MSKLSEQGIQKALSDDNQSAIQRYGKVVVGKPGMFALMKYEMITGLGQFLPGALGIVMRRKLYRFIIKSCGRGVVIGHNVTFRNPNRMVLGDNVIIGNNCTLDAKGETGEGIIIENGVLIGESTILSTADGTIRIGEKTNVSSFCRIATLTSIDIGRKVLIAAYCYICGGGHRHDRTDIPIMDQENYSKGPQSIGDGCWIGARSTLLDGVNVGNDVIIGAHSLVSSDLPGSSIAYGTPAQVIKTR